MARPKYLISLGEAWVDPYEVAAIDETFSDDDPPWANVRVILLNGKIVYGLRAPERIARAVRHPEQEHEAEEDGEVYPDRAEQAQRRARRRNSSQPTPRPLRRGDDG